MERKKVGRFEEAGEKRDRQEAAPEGEDDNMHEQIGGPIVKSNGEELTVLDAW